MATAAPSRALLSALLVALVVAGCAAALSPTPAPAPELVKSNVLRADYAGSAACEACHAPLYSEFMKSPMHRMTRHAMGDEVHAPFDGQIFHFKGDAITMTERDGRRYIAVDSKRDGAELYRVTKVIGGHYREDYVGEKVASMDPDARVLDDARGEHVMPVSWLLFASAWRYKGYSVMLRERPHTAGGAVWRQTCIFCHNTVPRLASLYDDFLPDGEKYQGSVSERFLPAVRTWRFVPTDRDGLARAVADETAVLGVPRPTGDLDAVLASAIDETREHFGERNLVELGIGCEACHNGSKEHVQDPSKHPSFELRSDVLRVESPPGAKEPPTRAEWINRTCVKCHTVLFSEYPYTWEGGLRAGSPGGSQINSGEARDFILGACATQMACPTCHDPHAGSDRARLDALGTVSGNGTCLNCHRQFSSPEALHEHTHHSVDGEGSACLSCHMPKKNMGLAYRLTRYHRIGSPNEPVKVEGDRPLECALCHADRSVENLVSTMERWWGHHYDRDKLRALYGKLDANPLLATLAYGKPHEQATAATVLGERGGKSAEAAIALQLVNPYPLVRYFARRALEQASGSPVPIDVEADTDAIQRATTEWLDAQASR
jgi:predicted CXXCH cytochrome family protein